MNASATDSVPPATSRPSWLCTWNCRRRPLRASVQDQRYARQLHDRGVSLRVVESAFLLGLRRRRHGRSAGDPDQHRPEVVFHLAAQIDVRHSVAIPNSTRRST